MRLVRALDVLAALRNPAAFTAAAARAWEAEGSSSREGNIKVSRMCRLVQSLAAPPTEVVFEAAEHVDEHPCFVAQAAMTVVENPTPLD
jgi:hypothetical protein